MQTWNLQKRPSKTVRSTSPKRWWTRTLAALLLLLTFAVTLYDLPWAYSAIDRAFGNRLPDVATTAPYRLGLDLQGGSQLTYDVDVSALSGAEIDEALQGVRDVVERRVNAFGVGEPRVQVVKTSTTSRLLVELPGVHDIDQAIAQIGETPILEFKEPGFDLEQDLTPELQAEKDRVEAEAKVAAELLLGRAQKGELLDTLIEGTPSQTIALATPEHALGSLIIEAINQTQTRPGQLIPKLIETGNGSLIARFNKTTPAKEWDLSHILICFEGKTNCANPIPALDASLQIEELRAKATAENFAELAKASSQDTSNAAQGGALGWHGPNTYVPAFELAASTLAVGQVSQVVETEFGYHLLLKHGERPITAYDVSYLRTPGPDLSALLPHLSPWQNTTLSGKHLKRSQVQFDPQTNTPVVALEFNEEGAALFAELTTRLAQQAQPIAIFLDQNPEPISVATVNEPIYGGQAVIQGGDLDLNEAKLLAQRLNAGALPVAIELSSEQTVGPSLGSVSLHKSLVAGCIGFLLVALFMIVVYRLPGLMAVLALALYAGLNLAAYRFFGVTITLSSIAGLILSLGIAVDANVLVFERFKEEYKAGHDLPIALENGFSRAWTAIRDGNVTTLIATAILYWFSTSFIQGFALTLSIGVLLSMFTAFVVTRTLTRWLIRIPRLKARVSWLGLTSPSSRS